MGTVPFCFTAEHLVRGLSPHKVSGGWSLCGDCPRTKAEFVRGLSPHGVGGGGSARRGLSARGGGVARREGGACGARGWQDARVLSIDEARGAVLDAAEALGVEDVAID